MVSISNLLFGTRLHTVRPTDPEKESADGPCGTPAKLWFLRLPLDSAHITPLVANVKLNFAFGSQRDQNARLAPRSVFAALSCRGAFGRSIPWRAGGVKPGLPASASYLHMVESRVCVAA